VGTQTVIIKTQTKRKAETATSLNQILSLGDRKLHHIYWS